MAELAQEAGRMPDKFLQHHAPNISAAVHYWKVRSAIRRNTKKAERVLICRSRALCKIVKDNNVDVLSAESF